MGDGPLAQPLARRCRAAATRRPGSTSSRAASTTSSRPDRRGAAGLPGVPAKAEEAAGDAPIVRPIFEPGDALFFDELFLHQTGVGPVDAEPALRDRELVLRRLGVSGASTARSPSRTAGRSAGGQLQRRRSRRTGPRSTVRSRKRLVDLPQGQTCGDVGAPAPTGPVSQPARRGFRRTTVERLRRCGRSTRMRAPDAWPRSIRAGRGGVRPGYEPVLPRLADRDRLTRLLRIRASVCRPGHDHVRAALLPGHVPEPAGPPPGGDDVSSGGKFRAGQRVVERLLAGTA